MLTGKCFISKLLVCCLICWKIYSEICKYRIARVECFLYCFKDAFVKWLTNKLWACGKITSHICSWILKYSAKKVPFESWRWQIRFSLPWRTECRCRSTIFILFTANTSMLFTAMSVFQISLVDFTMEQLLAILCKPALSAGFKFQSKPLSW